jgi:hypothetical protein
MRVSLNVAEIGALFRQVPTTKDDSDLQNLLRSLQTRINGITGEIDLTPDEVERISHNAFDRGNGEWEDRLVGIFGRVLGHSLGRCIVKG